MNKNLRILRKSLVFAFLISGLVLISSSRINAVHATSCEEAFYQYVMADWAYDTARISWFYNSPTSCEADCANQTGPAFDQCVNECKITRQTTLAAADVDLFAKSLETCTPATIDECSAARALAEGCLSQYPYPDYSDMDERLAVYDQYSACRLASKIDSCQ